MKKRLMQSIVVILLIIAFLIMFEQYITYGTFWTWEQFLHHENFSAVTVFLAIGFAIGFYIKQKKMS